MQTIDEIRQEEQARLERAWQYQKVLSRQTDLRATITRLTPQVTEFNATIDLLTRIETLASDLPERLTGTHSFQCRAQIVGACLAARTSEQKRRAKAQREIADAEAALPEIDAMLAQF